MGQTTLAILGGGQLGKMLAQEASNLHIQTATLSPKLDCPCAHISSVTKGSLNSFDDIINFGQKFDHITFEIEKVNVKALKHLQDQGKKVYPSAAVLKVIQDKGLQKQFYTEQKIKTSPYELVDEIIPEQLKARIPFVQKARKGGFDGRGVKVVRAEEDLRDMIDASSVIEELIDIKAEYALLLTRTHDKEIKAFRPVELVFYSDRNILDYLIDIELEKSMQDRLLSIGTQIIDALDVVGNLAVEFFETKEGEILINEVSPRPHNSGHHTLKAYDISQFEQHVRATLELPIKQPTPLRNSVMLNLITNKNLEKKISEEDLKETLTLCNVAPYLYGKEAKLNRKVGHITIFGDDREELLSLVSRVKNSLPDYFKK